MFDSYCKNASCGQIPSEIASHVWLENSVEITGHCFRRKSATLLTDGWYYKFKKAYGMEIFHPSGSLPGRFHWKQQQTKPKQDAPEKMYNRPILLVSE